MNAHLAGKDGLWLAITSLSCILARGWTCSCLAAWESIQAVAVQESPNGSRSSHVQAEVPPGEGRKGKFYWVLWAFFI
jgi:hypothetical protein